MALDVKKFTRRLDTIVRHSRTRKIVIGCIAAVAAFGIIGSVAPPLLRNKIAAALSDKLHRPVSIKEIWVNPFAMTATVRGLVMKKRRNASVALSFDELYLNLQLQSLFRWAPVIRQVRLVKPYINLVRNEDRKYNFQDLIDEFASGSEDPSAPPSRFAVYNIEIVDGHIDFDDRPEQTKHTIASLRIGVPFISSLPADVDIEVKPAFSALIDGAPLKIDGETYPFKDSRETRVQLEIKDLNLPKYLAYSPVQLNFTVPSGRLNGRLTASFRNFKAKPPALLIAGNLALKDMVLHERGDIPLLSLPALELNISSLDIFNKRTTIQSIHATGLELHVKREQNGQVNVAGLVTLPAQPPAAGPQKAAAPFIYRIDDFELEGGRLFFLDETPAEPYRNILSQLRLTAKGLTNEKETKSNIELSFQSDSQEQLNYHAMVQLDPLLIEGKFDIKGLRLGPLFPYYESIVNLEVREGLLDVTGEQRLASEGKELQISVGHLNAGLRSLQLYLAGRKEPLWRIPNLRIEDTNVDVNKKMIAIGVFESEGGKGSVEREADGTIGYARLFKPKADSEPSQTAESETPWQVSARRVDLKRYSVVFTDRSLPKPAKIVISDLSWRQENISNTKDARSQIALQARLADKGTLRLTGSVGIIPLSGSLKIQAKDIDLVPFQPYMAPRVNFVLTGGRIGTTGTLSIAAAGQNHPWKAGYEGNLQIADLATVMKNESQDLLRWKTLDMNRVQFALEPMQLSIDEVKLHDFYSRLFLGADGKFNLQQLVVRESENKPSSEAQRTSASPASSSAAPDFEKVIHIGKITLEEGNINFSDFYIKPNYSANLTEVNGHISELQAEAPADIEIQAKLNHSAPADIRGKINPLAKDLFLDLAANVEGIELSPLSPYSAKYVGYGIESGKLSFKVKYRLKNRALTADNQITLNQLTFGKKVESPDAIKLPVLLGVALLKDRNGVIDVDLPVSGSLDNPQFSVGGIVLKVIYNIISRAVTAPFAMLGRLFGGGEDLSYVAFDDGRATLTQAARQKLDSLATAMKNRPALHLELIGRVDPSKDTEGLKKASLERKVKEQKMKDLRRQGTAPKSIDEVRLEKDEYPRYLKAAYGEESFPKPRNIIGLAKDLPVAEMEKLMLQHTEVTNDDLSRLAHERAQAAKDYLLTPGQVSAGRLSIVSSNPGGPGAKDHPGAKASRVDFSLK